MRRLAALLLLLAFASAEAALNTEGVPAGAVGIIGFDLTAFRATKVGQSIEKLADLKSKNLEASRKLSDKLGVDTAKDLQGLVVAIYPGPDGKVAEKNASGVVLIRGKFDPARLNAFAEANKLPGKTAGKYQAWEARYFIEKLSGEKTKNEMKDAYLVAHSPELIVIAGADFLERALEAADRKEKADLVPAATAAKFAAVTNGWLYLYADATKMKNAKEEIGALDLALVLGENATDLQLATAANFISAEKAALMRKQLAGLQAFAVIGLMNDDGKSAEEKENLALLAELVQKIRLGGEGKTVTLELDYPADKAAQAIAKAIQKSQQRTVPPAK
ncbi:MAG: hypothetical protein RJA95_543 [Verrucomicrobiota bacterium]|jgi:hypothetical protein